MLPFIEIIHRFLHVCTSHTYHLHISLYMRMFFLAKEILGDKSAIRLDAYHHNYNCLYVLTHSSYTKTNV